MEAWRFGFTDEPSAHKFNPTDEDIVAHYLLPRAVGVRSPYEHAVIDDDPCSCPPWELLRRHGHGDSDQAFFFVPPRRDMERNAGRVWRVVAPAEPGGVGGVWRGLKGAVDKELVVVCGGGDGGGGAAKRTIKFRRYDMTYCRRRDGKTCGWVMHEYHVVDPVLRPGAVIARIKITERAKKAGRREPKLEEEATVAGNAAAAAAVVPGPDQPGPSNYFVSESDGDDYGHAAGNAAVASIGGEGFSNNDCFDRSTRSTVAATISSQSTAVMEIEMKSDTI